MDYFKQNITGIDFSSEDMTGANFAHATLTGCRFGVVRDARFICAKGVGIDFRGADVTGSTFEKASDSFLSSLVGAIWEGQEITSVGVGFSAGLYWCFCTNVFVQIGCMVQPLTVWKDLGASLTKLQGLPQLQAPGAAEGTFQWWQEWGFHIEMRCRRLSA